MYSIDVRKLHGKWKPLLRTDNPATADYHWAQTKARKQCTAPAYFRITLGGKVLDRVYHA